MKYHINPSSISIIEFTDTYGKTVVRKQQGLLVEKCRFLESAGCARTCLHACKIPTQRFFLEEMGLPVTLSPNMTDFRYPIPINHLPHCIANTTNAFILRFDFICLCELYTAQYSKDRKRF